MLPRDKIEKLARALRPPIKTVAKRRKVAKTKREFIMTKYNTWEKSILQYTEVNQHDWKQRCEIIITAILPTPPTQPKLI